MTSTSGQNGVAGNIFTTPLGTDTLPLGQHLSLFFLKASSGPERVGRCHHHAGVPPRVGKRHTCMTPEQVPPLILHPGTLLASRGELCMLEVQLQGKR